ncbi:Putative membrane protein [Corynebacterium glyciniphilum AJ 3170]|uniref:Putative membrane protein n=2 Tax=Corynebacterium TaxID=1716 RepID=X5DWW3_9CORY|nr:hypothetical protein [Corynebacterium glyciniphilum]AHW65122.1 Putative membrane protein [Corynebacterium glyciniphilum AJ 3170]
MSTTSTTRHTTAQVQGRTRRIVRSASASATVATLCLGIVACSGDGGEGTYSAVDGTTTATVTVTSTVTETTVPDHSAVPDPEPDPVPEPCSLESLHRTEGMEALDVLIYCDGAWMRAGQWQTDHLRNLVWTGDMWVEYLPDDTTPGTGYPCYDAGRLEQDGVPPALRDQLTLCE